MSIVLWHNSQSWGLSCLHVDDTKSAQDSSYHIWWLFPLYRNSKCCPYWIQLWLLATLPTVPVTWTPFHNLWCFWWSLYCCIKTLMTNESHSKQPKFQCKTFFVPCPFQYFNLNSFLSNWCPICLSWSYTSLPRLPCAVAVALLTRGHREGGPS